MSSLKTQIIFLEKINFKNNRNVLEIYAPAKVGFIKKSPTSMPNAELIIKPIRT